MTTNPTTLAARLREEARLLGKRKFRAMASIPPEPTDTDMMLGEAAALIEQQQAIIDRLRKWSTADGVFLFDMADIDLPWFADEHGAFEVDEFGPSSLGDVRGRVQGHPSNKDGYTLTRPINLCWSTREAAEAARVGKES